MSTSSHFSPTKNFWSWGASGQGRRSSTRCLPPARCPSSDLICPIFSNKWLYLNISRILQIHDQGNSDILLSVGWSFKMANTWDHWSMQLGAMHSVHCTQNYSSNIWQLTRMVDSTSIDKNGWFWYFYRQDWLILPKQRINILGDACHFGDEKQQNGSPNQQNVNPYQQSGSQKREISWYISTSGV